MTTPEPFAPTIAAIATPPGQGGIAIVRLSGAASLPILKKLFRPRQPACPFESHRLYYGWVVQPATGTAVDEVLAVVMRAPRTYTREDVVEIHCHGGPLVVREILTLVLAAGAVPAAAGEFTRRAFLGGRIDLTQAEAVVEMLTARTSAGLRLAAAQLGGGLQARLAEVREALLDIRALLEVAIDFPDEEADILDGPGLRARLTRTAIEPLRELIAAADHGRIFQEGVSVVILGRPNVGKSSLLNALLREERAIVTATPGTTRDTIEEYIAIQGVPVRLVDTAGIRATSEAVEELGIQRARRKAEEADLVLLLCDLSQPLAAEDRELYAAILGRPVILVANKHDLIPDPARLGDLAQAFPGEALVPLSAKTLAGLADLEEAIYTKVAGAPAEPPGPVHWCAPNARHRAALVKTLACVEQAGQGLSTALAPDLLAVDVQEGLDLLAEIVGQTTTEDVLDRIFSRFCIGK